jgi:hypothetical protein
MPEIDYWFVCDCGVNRSPTGARVFREMGWERRRNLKTDFMGFGIPESSAGKRIIS